MADVLELPNPDETITHTLKHPMMPKPGSTSAGLGDPSEVRLRPVYVADLEAIDKDDLSGTACTMLLISRLGNLDMADVRRLHQEDYQAIAGVIAARMGKGVGLSEMLLALASRQIGETA
jgi:hypothetical protein